MKPIQLNKRFDIELDNIEKIKERGNIFLVYRKKGYPKIIKSLFPLKHFLHILINRGFRSDDLIKFKKDYLCE